MTAFEDMAAETLRRWIRLAEQEGGPVARHWIRQCRAALTALEDGDGNLFVREVAQLHLDDSIRWQSLHHDLKQKPRLAGAKKRGKTKKSQAVVRAKFAELTKAAKPINGRLVQKSIIADLAKEFEISESTVRRCLRSKDPFDSK